jgi:hypothetical protein
MTYDPPISSYQLADNNELWWCNSHQRRATYVRNETDHCCDPNLGGIMLPCRTVNLTGIMEIDDENLP